MSGGSLVSNGFNLGSDATCNLTAPTDRTGADAKLQPLALNAPGDTPTHALASDSPAINQVTYSYNGCGTTVSIDQRGADRLKGIKCDSGAYEAEQPALDCTPPYQVGSDAALNEAILCINDAGPGNHTIDLTGPITLSGPATPFLNSQATEITVTGNGHEVDGDGRGTVFTVGPQTAVHMSEISVTGGQGSSGINHNEGGGFFVQGELTLTQATIDGNSAVTGGGLSVDGEAGPAMVTILETLITNNHATVTGGGLNVAGTLGQATVSLTDSSVSNNTSDDMGGGLNVSGRGGKTLVTVSDSTIGDNQARTGGGVFVNGGSGGTAEIALTGSTLSGNSASTNGGAMVINGNLGQATASFLNSTVSGNQAGKGGGAIVNSGNGGTAVLEADYTTFTDNSAGSDGLLQSGSAATATFTASILSGPGNVDLCDINGGEVSSGDYNISSDTSCNLTGSADLTGVNAGLEPLALNLPGTTWTHALNEDSPALDRIPDGNGGCGTAVATDQRGVTRPQPAGGQCDSGAYELGNDTPPPVESYEVFLPVGMK
ncbi:MAG: choice-of-anchor Q domain-containing protein [Chloroflexota bacterium]